MKVRFGMSKIILVDIEDVLNDVGTGWQPLVRVACELCARSDVSVAQVKEKFAGLRIYLNSAPIWLVRFMGDLEELSYHICENCGLEGTIHSNGYWIKTLCTTCAVNYNNQSWKIVEEN